MTLVRAARYAAWCRAGHRPLDGAARFQASTVAQAHKGSCVRRTDVGTDRRWFGESGRTVEAARNVPMDLSRGDTPM